MKGLSDNWLTEGLLDFEYKKYVLLGYLKHVQQQFGESQLYPHLADLVRHHSKLSELKQQIDHLEDAMPKELYQVDWEHLKLLYQKAEQEGGDTVRELYDIVAFALPKVKAQLIEGKERYDFVERHLELSPVGVSPVYQGEGYLVLGVELHPFWEVYRYRSTVFVHAEERYRGLNLTFISRIRRSVGRTLEQLKLDLVRQYKELPNPATFRLVASKPFPLESTLLPIGKRLLMRNLHLVA